MKTIDKKIYRGPRWSQLILHSWNTSLAVLRHDHNAATLFLGCRSIQTKTDLPLYVSKLFAEEYETTFRESFPL